MKHVAVAQKNEMSLLKGGDIFIILLLLGGVVWWYSQRVLMVSSSAQNSGFSVQYNNEPLLNLSSRDTVVEVQGAEGSMTLEVVDQKIHVRQSSCAHQICVKQGFVGAGGVIVCVPNMMVITPLKPRQKIDSYVR